MMRTIAPAKINWTLEVLGKRPDGYHEIRSVMQTIDLCDEVSVERAGDLCLEVTGNHEASEGDLALKAARSLAEKAGRKLPVLIRVEKRIPVAAGLGGGSSDAAATLRLLNRYRGVGLSIEELSDVGAKLGSDVPFFLRGGSALVEGRGERVTPLPDIPQTWLVLLVPPFRLAEKTKRMYESLSADRFTDGSWTDKALAALRAGERFERYNVFQVPAYLKFDRLTKLGDALRYAGARTIDVAGSGPAIWSPFGSKAEAEAAAREAGSIVGGFAHVEADIFVVRTLGRAEATEIVNG